MDTLVVKKQEKQCKKINVPMVTIEEVGLSQWELDRIAISKEQARLVMTISSEEMFSEMRDFLRREEKI